MRRDLGTVVALFLTLATAVVACAAKKPKGGDVCRAPDEGTWTCSDERNALLCGAGTYGAVPCRGPKGCTGKPREASCDTSVRRVGDACVDTGAETDVLARASCTEDKTSRVRCVGGKVALDVSCKGPKHCVPGEQWAPIDRSCDRTVVDEGDPCNLPGARDSSWGACSADGKKHLECSDDSAKGTFVVAHLCHGPKGCVAPDPGKNEPVACDRSVAAAGAPCAAKDAFHLACTPDGAGLVGCRGGVYEAKQTCAPKRRCGKAFPTALDPSCVDL